MAKRIVTPIRSPEDMDSLQTASRTNLTGAVNEVLGVANAAVATGAANTAAAALAEKVVHVAIGLAGPVAIAALPAGAIIIGVQAHVTSAYPAGAKIYMGDHSGGGGTLSDHAISDGTGITATAGGDYGVAVYKTPSGALSVTINGGDGSTGAATVVIKYIDA